MTKWPKDDKHMNFEDLTGPVYKAIKQVYKLTPKDYGERIKWTGPALPKSMEATCLSFEEALTKEQLKYDEEDQGRDPLKVLIGIAVQLGIEQGRRINKKDVSMDIVISSLEIALRYLKRL